jgi:hypothetical protein
VFACSGPAVFRWQARSVQCRWAQSIGKSGTANVGDGECARDKKIRSTRRICRLQIRSVTASIAAKGGPRNRRMETWTALSSPPNCVMTATRTVPLLDPSVRESVEAR